MVCLPGTGRFQGNQFMVITREMPGTGRFKGNQFMVITGEMKTNIEKYWEADGESGEAKRPEVEKTVIVLLCDDYMQAYLVLGRGCRPAVHFRSSAKPRGPDGNPQRKGAP